MMFDPDTQGALDATRAKLMKVQSLLLEVCEIASDDVVGDYLAEAFGDWQSEIQHSLDEVAYVFGAAATDKYNEWKETQ